MLRGTLNRIWVIFFHDPFRSGLDSGLIFRGRACYQLVSLFSISVDSPRDKRERSCSRNRKLGFKIKADNGRFFQRARTEYGCVGITELSWLVGAQGGIRTRNALENYSSVARVTAVHTLGRLPQAADRAILPQRTPYSRNRARARHTMSWAKLPRKSLQA